MAGRRGRRRAQAREPEAARADVEVRAPMDAGHHRARAKVTAGKPEMVGAGVEVRAQGTTGRRRV